MLLTLLLLVAAAVAGCGLGRPVRVRFPVRVGVAAVLPLRGELTPWGEAALAGVRLAVQDAAPRLAGRGIQVVLEPLDEGQPEAAVARTHLPVARPEVLAVIGHLDSATAIPASEIYAQGGLVLLSPTCTAPEFTGRGLANVFQWLPDDRAQADRLAAFAAEVLKAGRALVVHDRTGYGQGLADAFLAWGGRLAGYRGVRRGAGADGSLAAESERRGGTLSSSAACTRLVAT